MQHRARRRIATLLLPIVVMVMSSIAAGLTSHQPGAPGSCRRPTRRRTSRRTTRLADLHQRRVRPGRRRRHARLGVRPGRLAPRRAGVHGRERRAHRPGLPPIDYMTAQLDAYAQAGANAGTDPAFPTTLTGARRSPSVAPSGPAVCPRCSRPTTTGCTTTAGVAPSTTNAACSLSHLAGVLGPPRHHPAPVRQLPRPARRCSPWAPRSRRRDTPAAPSPPSWSVRARRRPT